MAGQVGSRGKEGNRGGLPRWTYDGRERRKKGAELNLWVSDFANGWYGWAGLGG